MYKDLKGLLLESGYCVTVDPIPYHIGVKVRLPNNVIENKNSKTKIYIIEKNKSLFNIEIYEDDKKINTLVNIPKYAFPAIIKTDIFKECKDYNFPSSLVVFKDKKGNPLENQSILELIDLKFSEEDKFKCELLRRRCFDFVKGHYTSNDAKKDDILDGINYLYQFLTEGKISSVDQE